MALVHQIFNIALLSLGWVTVGLTAAPTAEQVEFFERKIRPVLAEHCYECHNSGGKETQFVDEEGMDDTVMNEGEVVVMRDETGEELHGVVIGVTEEEVEVDFNHPLAGIDLHFSVQLMTVEGH